MARAILLILLILTSILALVNGMEVFYRISYALAGFLAVSYLWSKLSLHGVNVHSSLKNSSLTIGQEGESSITIENNSLMPKVGLEMVQDSDVPGYGVSRMLSLAPGQSISWTDKFACFRRGRYSIGQVNINASDLMGIFKRNKLAGNTVNVTIYPATVELPNFAIPPADLPGEGRYRRRTHFITPNASSVREYSYGDGFNRIHWASSAKTGKLMVKEFELDPASEIWLMLDLHKEVQAGSGMESTEEYGVTIAASIGKRYLDSNRSIGFIMYGQEYKVLRPERGGHQMSQLMESLALAKAEGPVPLESMIASEGRRFGKYTTLIVVTPSCDDKWITSAQHLIRRGAKLAVVLLEANSFGGSNNALLALGTLMANRIPAYLVRKGDNLSQALSSTGDHSTGHALTR